MKKLLLIQSLLVGTIIVVGGCAPRGYSKATVGENMRVEYGVVESVKQVIVDNDKVGNTVGALVGTLAGGVAGSHVGGGKGKVVATTVGAALGGALGGTIGNEMDTNYGQEVVVKLNDGQRVATVLRVNESSPFLSPGQAVNVFYSNGRVSNISVR